MSWEHGVAASTPQVLALPCKPKAQILPDQAWGLQINLGGSGKLGGLLTFGRIAACWVLKLRCCIAARTLCWKKVGPSQCLLGSDTQTIHNPRKERLHLIRYMPLKSWYESLKSASEWRIINYKCFPIETASWCRPLRFHGAKSRPRWMILIHLLLVSENAHPGEERVSSIICVSCSRG